ncbi:MAG TPA: cellulose synthase operon protein YhjQ/BcsQ [Pirellulales bacterium]|nr:cellulose synthase operon protein YhjQ/BcsQ [Pirellulales bacterium]
MTVLDQALIKAYQRRTAGGPHAQFLNQDHEPRASVAPALVAGPPALERHASASVAPALVAGPPGTDDRPPRTRPGATLPDPVQTSPHPALEIERFDWPPLVDAMREAACDQWASLVEQLLGGAQTLLVTGCRRGEGRTSIALFVAAALAADGRRVGLIDTDFARPQLAARLGVLAAAGWTEAISQRLAVAEAMVESLTDRVILLPLRELTTESTSSSVDATTVKTAIAGLRTHCDLVCIDAGPVADDTDQEYAAVLASGIDAALVVRDVRHSRLQQSHAVGRRLAQAGIDCWAIIENFTRDAHV